MSADTTADVSPAKRVLGLSAGARGGSAEIALKQALRGAESTGAAVGMLRVDGEPFRVEVGRPLVDFAAAGQAQSVLTLAEKLDHFHEVQATAAAHSRHRDAIDALAADFAEWDPSIAPTKDRL